MGRLPLPRLLHQLVVRHLTVHKAPQPPGDLATHQEDDDECQPEGEHTEHREAVPYREDREDDGQ